MGQHDLVDHSGHSERDHIGVNVHLSLEDDKPLRQRPTWK